VLGLAWLREWSCWFLKRIAKSLYETVLLPGVNQKQSTRVICCAVLRVAWDSLMLAHNQYTAMIEVWSVIWDEAWDWALGYINPSSALSSTLHTSSPWLDCPKTKILVYHEFGVPSCSVLKYALDGAMWFGLPWVAKNMPKARYELGVTSCSVLKKTLDGAVHVVRTTLYS
jgi:hypothetical protein